VAFAPPLDRARTLTSGTDATLLCYGPMVRTCAEAAVAAQADGRSIEVIDLRSIAPLDTEAIFTSVRKTGRCIVVHEAPVTGGLGGEIAALVTQECFYRLEAPVLRVGGYSTPYPPSRIEEHYLPDLDRVLDAVDRAFIY
jgi:pyruvate dehydrogenase E1 component beta subunit